MGLKRFVAGTILAATSWVKIAHENEVGLKLAHPQVMKDVATPGTQKACKDNPREIINNTCRESNQELINGATSLGFTCYSANVDGHLRVTCENGGGNCQTTEIITEELNLRINGSSIVQRHTCPPEPNS